MKIKRCPFCNCEMIEASIDGSVEAVVVHEPYNCILSGEIYYLEKWQSRPIEDKLEAENARLKEEVARLKVDLKFCLTGERQPPEVKP
jgi:hypothetical protein